MHSIFPSPAKQDFLHCYKLCNYNIVLDIASGSIHSVDDVTYDIINLYDAYREFARRAGGECEAFSQWLAKQDYVYPDVTGEDIRAIADDIDKLIAKGKLFAEDTFEEIAVKQTSKENALKAQTLKALCLNVSHVCNMNCAYCFAGTQQKEPSQPPQDALMTLETGKQAVNFLARNSGGQKTLDIDFFGGEPLLNWQVVKALVSYARSLEEGTGKKFRFTLTTNGLLIDDDVIAFTNKEFHNVVLSLDGRREVHDKMRKLPDGRGSYDEVLPNIIKLVQARREKGYYIRGTFTRENMDFVNDILHIAELGFLEISLEPAVAKPGDSLAFTKADLPELFKQYDTLAVEMRRRKDNAKFLRPSDVPKPEREFNFYHFNIDLEHGPCIHKRLAGCGAGTGYLAVTPSGELYPCHQFIGDETFKMGDVRTGIVNQDIRVKFASLNIYSRSECKSCWARFYCSGGCAANAYHATGKIDGIFDFGCELFKERIENAIMLKF